MDNRWTISYSDYSLLALNFKANQTFLTLDEPTGQIIDET